MTVGVLSGLGPVEGADRLRSSVRILLLAAYLLLACALAVALLINRSAALNEGQRRVENLALVLGDHLARTAGAFDPGAAATRATDAILHDKGIHVIPDVMANAGGVVCSYFEWVQNLQHFRWEEYEVNQRLEKVIKRGYSEVAEKSQTDGTTPRIAAYELGIGRVVEAAQIRGYIP